ncbi:Ku protein [Roseomonas terrae]|jgi:DNA end-binding protein Ku|uniref:Non-homologous end joining protein Ku n=1 Tax=Neoroseomonas terrae TaxID=424799 RepID=A0ABS5EBA9_9PROT|nr:Ku protein [Neoroseomonas terrae]MBR0648302.1 Ku protein [Neoroseomonas terrae]
MAPRPFWKGYLKLSLVSCPVAMIPATSETERVRFHTLNRKTGNRIRSQYIDAVTSAPLEDDDGAKGFARGENDYLVLEDEELDAVQLETTRTIDIDVFVPSDEVGWIWYDKPHYLMPDGAVGEEAFGVIRDAMSATGTVGIAKLVLYQRERAVLVKPRDAGMVVWTLRFGDEVRDPSMYFPDSNTDATPDLRKLIGQLIQKRTGNWDPDMVRDPVQERLLDIIASKRKGRPRRAAPKAPEPASNVVNIMDALRRSLAGSRS